MTDERYRSRSQQRVLTVLLRLSGNEFYGLTPGELAEALGERPANITRDLANLKIAGLAEQIEDTGRWRLGPKLVQIAIAFRSHVERCQTKLDELDQRHTRNPN